MLYLLLFVIIFAAVLLAAVGVRSMAGQKVDLRTRLNPVASATLPAADQVRLVNDSSGAPWARLIAAIEKRGVSLKASEGEALAEKLMLAGYLEDYAVRAFVLIKTALIICLPLIAYLIMSVTAFPSPTKLYAILGVVATIGMYLPNMIVSSKAKARKQEILNGFPDALDLMLVCIDAGLGIDATFARVGAEIVVSHPLLAELLATVSLELRAGRARDSALRNMSRRTGLPELTAFVTLLNQSAKLGSSIGQALKVYASEMRDGRRMRAEEKAARLPVLLSVPLVAFLLPTMVAVLMLPAAITVHANMSHVSNE